MICDKCGKSNISGLSECAYCGADMPNTSGGGGFADILSYNAAGVTTPPVVKLEERNTERVSEADMQKLIKKSDNIIKSTKLNSLFGLIAVGLSFLILISLIVFGIVTISTVNGYKKETMTQLEETQEELTEHKEQIDTLLKKIEETKEDIKSDIEEKDEDTDEDKSTGKDESDQATTSNTSDDKIEDSDKIVEKDGEIENTSSTDGNIKN